MRTFHSLLTSVALLDSVFLTGLRAICADPPLPFATSSSRCHRSVYATTAQRTAESVPASRLRPAQGFGSLTPFENQAVEVSGRAVTVTCTVVTVNAIQALTRTLSSQTTTAANLTVDVFGDGAAGDTFLVFWSAGVAPTPLQLPGIGPLHLDSSVVLFPRRLCSGRCRASR